MNIKLLVHTVCHLKFVQVVYQVYYRLYKPKFKPMSSPANAGNIRFYEFIPKWESFDGATFTFLNIEDRFRGWNFSAHGALWSYNLNYMDWLLQEDITFEAGAAWIDRFIDDLPENKVGLDPYPIALRGINWIKFISIHYKDIDQDKLQLWNDSLYSQYKLLERKLECHLLGNHLLEDAYSLFIASVYFRDKKMYRKALKLLRQQLTEQILPDGAHYEQSPMYHCILLDRLLDCYNVATNNLIFDAQNRLNDFLSEKAIMMLGHLESIIWSDGDIPLLNDSAYKIAPTPSEIFEYAKRLSLVWSEIPMKECGYRKFSEDKIETIVDVGNRKAKYQAGHTHSDLFSYEVRLNGKPFIVDTGISTYEKIKRRQYERSTRAHNSILVNDSDNYQVWGGFRVGRRAKTTVLMDTTKDIWAEYKIQTVKVIRRFFLSELGFQVSDSVNGDSIHSCKSFIHFADGVDIRFVAEDKIITSVAEILISGVKSVEVEDCYISREYNSLIRSKSVILIPKTNGKSFKFSYTIRPM